MFKETLAMMGKTSCKACKACWKLKRL